MNSLTISSWKSVVQCNRQVFSLEIIRTMTFQHFSQSQTQLLHNSHTFSIVFNSLICYYFRTQVLSQIIKRISTLSTLNVETKQPPRLLDQVRAAIRKRHYSYRTEQTYVEWIKRFILFHHKRHPMQMGVPEIEQFLTYLAVDQKVAASTQNQALSALLFLYRAVLHQELEGKIDAVRAKQPVRLPTVLSKGEVQRVLAQLLDHHLLPAQLLYGSGLRLMECLRLRVKDLDFEQQQIMVRAGKGDKDRATLFPQSLHAALQRQLRYAHTLHQSDLERGYGRVYLPYALARKYPNADREWAWQYVFPSHKFSQEPRSGQVGRHHLDPSGLQKAVKRAANAAKLTKRVTCHTFRHSFATHLLENSYDIRTVQELLGHKDVRTTMIYTHVLNQGPMGVRSPLDG